MGRMHLPSPVITRRVLRSPGVLAGCALILALSSPGACKQKISGTSPGKGGTPPPTFGAGPNALATTAPVGTSAPMGTKAPNPNLTKYGILKTPASAYVNPMITGRETSTWCYCRNVGTSPHIGWDLGFSGSNRSIAMANGIVKSKRDIGGGCGWEIILEDTGGARWRYLHLDSPSLASGTVVFQGALLGVHARYPSASCGTGPHLHLERHSGGAFGDAEKKKVCDAGYAETCNWDPKTPLASKRVISSTSDASALQAKNKAETEKAKAGYSADAGGAGDTGVPEGELAWIDETADECAFGQPEPSPVATLPAEAPDPEGRTLRAEVGEVPRGALRALVTLKAASAGNADGANACASGSCVTSWTLYAKGDAGWTLAVADDGLRERPIVHTGDALLCYPRGFTGEYMLEAVVEAEGSPRRVTVRGRTR